MRWLFIILLLISSCTKERPHFVDERDEVFSDGLCVLGLVTVGIMSPYFSTVIYLNDDGYPYLCTLKSTAVNTVQEELSKLHSRCEDRCKRQDKFYSVSNYLKHETFTAINCYCDVHHPYNTGGNNAPIRP